MLYEEIKSVEDPSDQELKRGVLKAFHGEKAWPHVICDADVHVRENGGLSARARVLR